MASLIDSILDHTGKLIRLGPRLLIGQSAERPHKGVAIQASEHDGAARARLYGQDATNPAQGAPVQVNPADGSVQAKLVSGSTTAVTQGTHDAATSTAGIRVLGTAYADPASLPADVSADGDDCRGSVDRKGVSYVRPAYQEPGDSESVPQKQVQIRGLWGTTRAASGQAIALGTVGVLQHLVCAVTTAGTLNLRDGAAGGPILWAGPTLPVGGYSLPIHAKITNGLYVEFIGGGGLVGSIVPTYAPDV